MSNPSPMERDWQAVTPRNIEPSNTSIAVWNNCWGAEQRNAFNRLWMAPQNRERLINLALPWFSNSRSILEEIDSLCEIWKEIIKIKDSDPHATHYAKKVIDLFEQFSGLRDHLIERLSSSRYENLDMLLQIIPTLEHHESILNRIMQKEFDAVILNSCTKQSGKAAMQRLLEHPSFEAKYHFNPIERCVKWISWSTEQYDNFEDTLHYLIKQGFPLSFETSSYSDRYNTSRSINVLLIASKVIEMQENNLTSAERVFNILVNVTDDLSVITPEKYPHSWQLLQQHPRIRKEKLETLVQASANQRPSLPRM